MANILGLNKVLDALKKAKRYILGDGKPRLAYVVGFSAKYSIFVHEDLEARHPNGGQAKYLEQPARQYAKELADIVARALKSGATMEQALTLAALRLQRESMALAPVDTGNLRASSYIRIEP